MPLITPSQRYVVNGVTYHRLKGQPSRRVTPRPYVQVAPPTEPVPPQQCETVVKRDNVRRAKAKLKAERRSLRIDTRYKILTILLEHYEDLKQLAPFTVRQLSQQGYFQAFVQGEKGHPPFGLTNRFYGVLRGALRMVGFVPLISHKYKRKPWDVTDEVRYPHYLHTSSLGPVLVVRLPGDVFATPEIQEYGTGEWVRLPSSEPEFRRLRGLRADGWSSDVGKQAKQEASAILGKNCFRLGQ